MSDSTKDSNEVKRGAWSMCWVLVWYVDDDDDANKKIIESKTE